jgi:hypothetical protein
MQYEEGSIGSTRLRLDLTDAGFDASVLSEFRARLIDQHAEELLLEKMLTLFQQKGWLKARGRQRTDEGACAGQDPRAQPSIVRVGNDACSQG